MIFTKPIQEITYQDVLDFCSEQHQESIHLDYKREVARSLVKTIAAMANTWGGVVVIGVDEEDSRPRLPVDGLPYEEHLRERINNLILGNVIPPLFPEIQVCRSPGGDRALIVVRIPQSQLTPHAIQGNSQVYLRTETSNEPEELASLDRIQWLIDRRKMSEDLKSSFHQLAERRFDALCGRHGVTVAHGDGTLSMTPLYPFELLCNPRHFNPDLLNTMHTRGWGASRFPKLLNQQQFEPVQNGTYAFSLGSGRYVCYEEFNQYGYSYHREDLARTERSGDGDETHFSYLHSLLVLLDLYLESMAKFYSHVGYWGILELRIILRRLSDVGFRDLPPPRGYHRFDNIEGRPLDDELQFIKSFSCSQLVEERPLLVEQLLAEMAWAVGFSNITSDTVHRLLEEANRL